MGEIHDYEMMMADIAKAEEDARIMRELNEMQAFLAKEAEYAQHPANWWQPGCPFKIKDIVYVAEGECFVTSRAPRPPSAAPESGI